MIDVGGTVGNYVVRSKIGEGGMGIVWFAEHPLIGKKVAIKVIHPTYARNPESVSRFFTEAQAVNRVGHPNIVDITDFGQTPAGESYFVMEYLAGESLAQRMAKGRLELRRGLYIVSQIADALAGSHDAGILHRDLKPDNVFLIQRGNDPDVVKVLDFGLAKLTGNAEKSQHKTRTGSMMGTPYYMAPEQCAGKADIDARADVYALGVILYEILTGKVPFPGDTYVEIIVQHMTQPAPRVRSLAPDCPEWLDELVDRLLVKDKHQRLQSMAELRDLLLAQLGELPSARAQSARPSLTTPVPRPMSTINLASGERSGLPTLSEKPGSRRGWLIGGALGVLVVSGGLYAALGGGEPPPQAAVVPPPAPLLGVDAAPVAAAKVTIELSGEPAGARVSREDGTLICEATPCDWQIEPSSTPIKLVFEKPGFVRRVEPVVADRNKSVTKNLLAEPAPVEPEVIASDETPAEKAKRERRRERRERERREKAEKAGKAGKAGQSGTTPADGEGLLKPQF